MIWEINHHFIKITEKKRTKSKKRKKKYSQQSTLVFGNKKIKGYVLLLGQIKVFNGKIVKRKSILVGNV